MKKSQMVELIGMAMKREGDFIHQMKGDTNPQIIEMVKLAEGKRQAYYSVLEGFKGFSGFLRIEAGQ